MKFKYYILLVLSLFFSSCEKADEETIYAFIGDSEVARWDLQQWFPSLTSENYGKGGSGLKYIQEHNGSMKGKSVVIEFGTNDIKLFDETYATQYVEAVAALQAEEVYLISMFPRAREGDREEVNTIIEDMNHQIEKLSSSYGWHYMNVFPLLLDGEDLNWNYYTDGLHLSALGYELVSNELRKALR